VATYPVIYAGQTITADLLTSMLTDVTVKASTESVTASTTLQNDDELFTSVAASATYDVRVYLLHSSGTAGDIKVGWTAPTGSVLTWGVQGAHTGSTSSSQVADVNMQTRTIGETASFGGGSSTGTTAVIYGSLTTSTTAGTLQLQWAQDASNATATQVRAGSALIVRRTA
jgi:hypothetical protein